MKWIKGAIHAIAEGIVSTLDWLVGVSERLVAIAVACVVFYIGWKVVRGTVDAPLKDTLKALSESWRVLLLLLIPLFYRAVRAFLERVEEFGGMKAPMKTKSADPTKQAGE